MNAWFLLIWYFSLKNEYGLIFFRWNFSWKKWLLPDFFLVWAEVQLLSKFGIPLMVLLHPGPACWPLPIDPVQSKTSMNKKVWFFQFFIKKGVVFWDSCFLIKGVIQSNSPKRQQRVCRPRNSICFFLPKQSSTTWTYDNSLHFFEACKHIPYPYMIGFDRSTQFPVFWN